MMDSTKYVEDLLHYSIWSRKAPESMEVDVGSFRILFSSRFPPRMNRVLREFLEAYARAVKETMREDRFPNLREVQERMQKGEVYNVKRRFLDGTNFFCEIEAKPKGVFLIPRAKKFVDPTGTFSPLAFYFEDGEVELPRMLKRPQIDLTAGRRKIEEGWKDYSVAWEQMERTSWRKIMSLENPLVYILLLVSSIVNVFLALCLFYLLRF